VNASRLETPFLLERQHLLAHKTAPDGLFALTGYSRSHTHSRVRVLDGVLETQARVSSAQHHAFVGARFIAPSDTQLETQFVPDRVLERAQHVAPLHKRVQLETDRVLEVHPWR
jgi:hypothetical protein